MCIPIFNPEKFDKERPAIDNELIGVLSFDSDDDLFDDFRKIDVLQTASDCAALAAHYLKPGT
jgi:hypothetical protein